MTSEQVRAILARLGDDFTGECYIRTYADWLSVYDIELIESDILMANVETGTDRALQFISVFDIIAICVDVEEYPQPEWSGLPKGKRIQNVQIRKLRQ